jgi:2-oxoglutarate ferredoxin oxidoreductase subunit alpha
MGHITEDPETRISMMEKRLSKLDLIQNTIPKEEQVTIEFENDTGNTPKKLVLILSWGSTKGAILDSLEKITETNDTIQFLYLQIKLLNPFPSKLLEDIVNNKIEKVHGTDNASTNIETILIIIEMNYLSQLDILIKQNTTLKSDHNILKYNGRPMSHTEIYNSLINIINNQSQRRVILKDGV